jgi:hypothetical protein
MSLAVLADHMASKGRGPDSMLIHMSPREVQGLQALAMKNGGSLTINPETGLPEAGFLDKLLPAIIGFALAPMTAGTSLAFLGATPFASALTVGGLQTLRTGDIGKGIQAGLGAYGGAGLQAGLATAGTSAIGSEAARTGAAAGLTGDMAFNLADAGITDAGIQSIGNVEAANQALQQQTAERVAERVAAASPMDKLSAGFDAAKNNPSSLLTKDNFKYLAAGAAPILADQAVKSNLPTTATKPGMIRPYSFDPYGGSYTAGTPYEAQVKKAAGGGLMGMDDGGYGPGQLDFTQRSEPVVRMAIGGDTKKALEDAYAAQDYKTVQDLVNKNQVTAGDVGGTWQGFDTSGLAGLGVNLYTKNDMFSPTNTRAEQESAVNQYYQNQGVTPDQLGQTNFGYPVDTKESRLANAPFTNLYEDYQKDLANTGRYDAPTDTQFRTQAVYEPAGLGNRGAIKLYDTATGQHLTNVDMGNQVQAFELLDKFGVDPASYKQALGASFGTAGVPDWQKDDYDYLMGYKPRNVASATTAYLAKPLQNLTVANLTSTYQKDANGRQTADSKVNTDWLGSTQKLLMSKGLGVEEASNLLHQFNGVAGLVNWAEINRSKDPVTAIIGTLNTLQSKGLTNQTGDKLRNVGQAMVDASGQLIGHRYTGADAARTKLRNLGFRNGLAEGGLASLANGGVPGYAGNEGSLVGEDAALKAYQEGRYGDASTLLAAAGMSAQDVVSKYGLSQADAAAVAKNLSYTGDMSGLTYAAPPPIVQAAAPVVQAPTYTQYTEDQMGSFLSNPVNKDIDLGKAIKDTNADPAAVNRYIASLTSPFVGSTESDRGSGTFGIYNNMVNKSISPDEYYAAAIANNPKYAGWTKDMIQEGYNLNKGMYALSDAKKGVVTDTDWAKLMVGKGTWDKPQYDPNEMAQATGLSIAEVRARFELEKLKANPTTKIIDNTRFTGTGTVTGGTGTGGYGTGGSGYTGRLEDVLGTGLPPGVSGAGITTVNPNGTITTRPNIPGIPEGGFTGMTDLRKAYTDGGGSLGYVPYAPKTIEEFNTKYNKLTGGSKQSYDYLMGKTPYDPTPFTKTGEIMKPYFESIGRFPENRKAKKYVYVDGKYQLNPDYVKPSYVLAGEKAAALTTQDKEPTESPGAGNKWTWNSTDKKWEAKPIGGETPTTGQNDGGGGGDANGGLMRKAGGGLAALTMAGGGMSGQFDLGGYSDGGRLLRGPGDGVSDSIPATIGNKRPARLADGEFVVPARIVSELGNGSTEAGARKLYAMMDRVQAARKGSIGKGKVAKNSRADKYLPA